MDGCSQIKRLPHQSKKRDNNSICTSAATTNNANTEKFQIQSRMPGYIYEYEKKITTFTIAQRNSKKVSPSPSNPIAPFSSCHVRQSLPFSSQRQCKSETKPRLAFQKTYIA
jgi:hypothetical protein